MTKKMIKPSRAVNAYWLRREKEGDVNITEPPKSRTPKTDKEA